MTFVVAGCPIRNRAWAIPDWVAAMQRQTRPPEAMLMLVEADSSEKSPDEVALRVEGFRRLEISSSHAGGFFSTIPPGEGGDQRIPGPNRYSMANLARARNTLVDLVLNHFPATHFWSCDSDVRPEPDTLEKLLAADKAVIGAPVRTGENVWTFMRGWREDDGEPIRDGYEAADLKDGIGLGWICTEFVGACVLHEMAVFSKARYADHPRGEDIPFCMALKAARIGIFLYPGCRTSHAMVHGEEPLRSWK